MLETIDSEDGDRAHVVQERTAPWCYGEPDVPTPLFCSMVIVRSRTQLHMSNLVDFVSPPLPSLLLQHHSRNDRFEVSAESPETVLHPALYRQGAVSQRDKCKTNTITRLFFSRPRLYRIYSRGITISHQTVQESNRWYRMEVHKRGSRPTV